MSQGKMKTLFVLFFYSISNCLAIGQFDSNNKFMVVNNDTVPFKVQKRLFINFMGDSMYQDYDPYPSFYIINGVTLNTIDGNRKRQGLWLEHWAGRQWQGSYIDNSMDGIWKTVDSLNYTESFIVKEYNTTGNDWIKAYYPDSSKFSTTDIFRYESYYILLFHSWYNNGNKKESIRYKFPHNRDFSLPAEKFEIDTTYKWYENGNLSYMSYQGGYKYFYKNGIRDTEVIYNVTDKGVRKIIHWYKDGNVESILYLKETRKDYNVKYGVWEFFDNGGKPLRSEVYRRGKLIRTEIKIL